MHRNESVFLFHIIISKVDKVSRFVSAGRRSSLCSLEFRQWSCCSTVAGLLFFHHVPEDKINQCNATLYAKLGIIIFFSLKKPCVGKFRCYSEDEFAHNDLKTFFLQ